MTMGKRKRTWDEEDAFGPWRKYLSYVDNPGVRKTLKRRTHKRERRTGKQEAEQ